MSEITVEEETRDAARPASSATGATGTTGTRRYVRGSSLLLVGRFVSVVLNFAVQVITVRYLSKAHYGAFAYGIGVAALGTSIVLLGLSKAIPRLVPIYHERRDEARAFGSIVLAAATILGLGFLLVVGLQIAQGMVATRAHLDRETLSLLLVLIALAPIDAFDNLLQQVVAVFCSPKAIFFRRQVLGPGLKLLAAALVVLVSGNVYLLAYGYVAGGLIGIALYVVALLREWRRQGLLGYLRPGRFRLPFGELFGFSVPLLSTELSVALRGSLVVVMLEYFRDAAAVAEFRAVLPVAGLNMVVFEAFSFLFVPLASRMFARDDRDGIGALYWQTSLWIAILTFPVFVVTCLLAPTLTVFLFGQRYAQAASLLAILSVGQYFNAALGFNAATLRVHGKVGMIVASDTLTALVSVGLGLALIREHGALGAALATTITLILQNVLNQFALSWGRTGITLFDWSYARVYVLMIASTSLVGGVQWLLRPPPYVPALLASVACLAAVRLSRRSIDPAATFPELARLPMLRWLLQ